MSLSLYVCPYWQLATCKFSHGLALLSDEGLELSHVTYLRGLPLWVLFHRGGLLR